jgi:hypothetical protein
MQTIQKKIYCTNGDTVLIPEEEYSHYRLVHFSTGEEACEITGGLLLGGDYLEDPDEVKRWEEAEYIDRMSTQVKPHEYEPNYF